MSQRISDFDVGLLVTLDTLLKYPNVTHAAARLNITQSALSARLTRLRQLLNDPLFVPAASGRGMIATPHASALEPELTRLLERFNDFVNTAHSFDPANSKRVFRIAATDNPAAILAPDLIPLFQAGAPMAKIAFTLPNKAKIAEHLEQGDVDLFVGAAEDGAPELIAQTLFQEEFVTAQRRGHPRGTTPLTIEEFCDAEHLLISTSGGHFSGMIDNALAEIGRERRVSISIQSYALAPLVLASTDCICTLPRRFLKRFEDTLDLFPPPLPLSVFGMNLFWHPRMRTDPAHIWLRKMVLQVAKTTTADQM
ncbi:LysR family transcriptional regulator [Rhizobium leguminosarum]|uniref:LysR family transcriptional regulator n=1 Tax=Rhizobium leguminosarum TaxID=384 RepID=A0A6P0B4C5_RHILE|nr:LysR family transcriptional regulator [Rhizobium leguminosarum]MBY5438632.1 LysR family transcriptional regulator [Rhizobium leguminosarum]NEI34046.1 LysR family transcriptional regulator [Rhizobium leguminosarum]NEI40409.1 LysR family transcriptional regulator [Rhizobium leguminosarum]